MKPPQKPCKQNESEVKYLKVLGEKKTNTKLKDCSQ